MPKKTELILTALPAGITQVDGNPALRVSVHVSPRLTVDGGPPNLSQFQDHFADWPAVVNQLGFKARFSAGPVLDAQLAQPLPSESSDLWGALFPPSTGVRSFEYPELEKQLVFSYPVGNVLGHLQGIYQRYATGAPDHLPPRVDLWRDPSLAAISFIFDPDDFRRIGAFLGLRLPEGLSTVGAAQLDAEDVREAFRMALIQRMRQRPERITRLPVEGPANAMPPGPPEPLVDFFQVKNFFTPPNQRKSKQEIQAAKANQQLINEYDRLPASIPIPDVDFHQIVATMSQHPRLQRELGLVIDLDVPLSGGQLGQLSGGNQPTVQIELDWSGAAPQPEVQIRPKTVYVIENDRFAPRPRANAPDLTATGLLRLADEGYELTEVDVDGAAIKALNFSHNLYRGILHRSSDSPLRDGLPALRSVGLALARTGGALRLANRLKLMAARNGNLGSDTEPLLFAEDVLQGYRVDVREALAGRWRSLHERIGEYDFDAGPERTYQDEGFIETAVTSAADDSSEDLYLHEVFALWDGWSLSAPKPGAWLTDDDNAARNRQRAESDLKMTTTYRAVPDSLPRLRFGRKYRLRVRAVDLAGNSPAFDGLDDDTAMTGLNPIAPDDFSAASSERAHHRFEPVPPPTVVLRDEIDDSRGESLERLVIRSMDAELTTHTSSSAQRHIAPPKGAWSLAEAHGALDRPSGEEDESWLTGLYELIARKQAAIDASGAVEPSPTDPNAAKGAFKTTKGAPAMKTAQEDVQEQDGLAPPNQSAGSSYPIYAADQVAELPYLPDPIARGAALLYPPGVAIGTSLLMPAAGGVQSAPIHQKDQNTLALARVEFARDSDPARWYDVGAFRIRVEDATGVADVKPKWDAASRLLTFYLPKAEVVQVPYACYPDNGDLELMGIWNWILAANPQEVDWLRRVALDGRHWMLTPRRTLTLVHAVQRPLQPPAFNQLLPPAGSYRRAQRAFGQTYAVLADTLGIHGKSTEKIDIEARWIEPVDDLSKDAPLAAQGKAHVCEIPVDRPHQDTLALDHRHELGDTKYRRVTYRAIATTRFREYLPTTIANDEAQITRASIEEPASEEEKKYAPVTVDVPNSARPEAPKLLYVVPAFRWEEKAELSAEISRREGGWLRVYMDRPWYSSGDGELLGVLFWNGSFAQIPEEYRPYVTQWGTDPIWLSAPVSGGASGGSFKAAVQTKYTELTLDELYKPTFTVQLTQIGGQAVERKLSVTNPTPKSQTQMTLDELSQITPSPYPPGTFKSAVAQVQQQGPTGVVAQVDASTLPTLAVAGHEVHYGYDDETGEGRKLWYSDIHVDAGQSYFPFIRLALVRFQPISVPNAHLSRVVIADFVQLAPDRTATINFDPNKPKELVLAVHGPTYQRSALERQQRQRLRAYVQTLREDVPRELGWIPVTGVDIDADDDPKGGALWTGKLTLPQPRGSRPYRVVIEELEGYPFLTAGTRISGQVSTLVAPTWRVVYAHTIEL